MSSATALTATSVSMSRQDQPEGATSPIQETPSRPLANRILLVATAACSILSVIPPLRLGAGLVLRSISFLSIFTTNFSQPEEGWKAELIKTGKVAAVVLGIAGLIAALPAIMIASLAIDLALQLYECCRNFAQGEPIQALMHLAMIVTGALSLVGFATGAWEFIFAALLLNAFVMAGFACANAAAGRIDETLCFLALFGANLAGSLLSAEMTRPVKTVTIHPSSKNDKIIVQSGWQQQIVAEGLPGQDVIIHDNIRSAYTVLHSNAVSTTRSTFQVPTDVIQKPLSPNLFGAMPMTAPAIHAVTQNVPSQREIEAHQRWRFSL